MSYFIDMAFCSRPHPTSIRPKQCTLPEVMSQSCPISKKGRHNQAAIGNSYEQLTTSTYRSIYLWSCFGNWEIHSIFRYVPKLSENNPTIIPKIRESAATQKATRYFGCMTPIMDNRYHIPGGFFSGGFKQPEVAVVSKSPEAPDLARPVNTSSCWRRIKFTRSSKRGMDAN